MEHRRSWRLSQPSLAWAFTFRFKKIPQVAVEVPEHSDGAVAFLLGLPNKDHAPGFERVEVAPEIIRGEKQEHATAGLISNSRRLFIADSSREKEPDSVEPGGATTTQRLACSGMKMSSTTRKPSVPT